MSKNIFLVGGNTGIGLQLVKQLNSSGHNLYVASRSNSNLVDFSNVNYMEFDASDISADLQEIPESIDGLVYLPGTVNLKPFNRIKPEDFETDWKINFLGAVNVIQQLFKSLKNGHNSSIVMISTVAVQTGLNFHASISSAKGAVEGLVRSLAAEFAPTIRVNAIAPSITNTPLTERLLNSETRIQDSAERHALKRVGKPEDQANAIEFLLSERSSWITGQIFHVDGGMSSIK